MNIDYVHLYTEEEFEEIQAKYDGKAEYNIVEQSGKIIQYSLEDGNYVIADVYKNHDEYRSTAFPDLRINLKDIFE